MRPCIAVFILYRFCQIIKRNFHFCQSSPKFSFSAVLSCVIMICSGRLRRVLQQEQAHRRTIEREPTMKRLNINKYYRYCSYSLDAQEANQQHYWFDMKHFKMIDHRGPCDMYDDNPDIIPFPHFIPESRYKDLMRALNNPQVTEFFNAAKDKEDVYFRYRVFIDKNGLSFTEQYRLNQDKAITLMKWCNDHDIPYIYRSEARGTYLQYDYDDLEGEIWQIPDME